MDNTTFSILPKQDVFNFYREIFTDPATNIPEPTGILGVNILEFALRDCTTVACHMFDTHNTDYAPDAKTQTIDNYRLDAVKDKTIFDSDPLQAPDYHSLSVGKIDIFGLHQPVNIYSFSINGSSHSSALTDYIIPWDKAPQN